MEANEVRNFLSKLDDFGFRYLRIQISMANEARSLVADFGLTRDQFCQLLQIKPREYDKYMTGGFNYDLKKMALMQAAYFRLHSERKAEETRKEAKENLTGVNL